MDLQQIYDLLLFYFPKILLALKLCFIVHLLFLGGFYSFLLFWGFSSKR